MPDVIGASCAAPAIGNKSLHPAVSPSADTVSAGNADNAGHFKVRGMDDGSTIFVIDDEAKERKLIAEGLAAGGWNVQTFTTNIDCLRELQGGARPACIVADLRMSHVSGAELIVRLRQAGIDIPVLIVTGLFPENALVQRAIEAGAAAILHRPIDPANVAVEIRRALRSGRGA